MPGIKFHDQANVFKKKKTITLYYNSLPKERCALYRCFQFQVPGCASAFTEAWSCFCWVESRTFKQEGGGKPHSSEESKSWNVSCCEVWDCQPQQVLTGSQSCGDTETLPGPARGLTGQKWIFSVSCEQHQSYCLFAREPNFLKCWTKISAGMVPKQTEFQHWICILHINICTLFFWRSLYKYV